MVYPCKRFTSFARSGLIVLPKVAKFASLNGCDTLQPSRLGWVSVIIPLYKQGNQLRVFFSNLKPIFSLPKPLVCTFKRHMCLCRRLYVSACFLLKVFKLKHTSATLKPHERPSRPSTIYFYCSGNFWQPWKPGMWHQRRVFPSRQLLHGWNFITRAKKIRHPSGREVARTWYLFKSALVSEEEFQLLVTYQFLEIVTCSLHVVKGGFNYLAILSFRFLSFSEDLILVTVLKLSRNTRWLVF